MKDETMGNQQGKVSEIDMAWLAGFLDGEGCFDLQKAYAAGLRRESWRPRVRVSNTDAATLETVCRILDAVGAGQHVIWREPQNQRCRRSWSVEIAGLKRGLRFLLLITPYLQTKRARAELLIDFARSRLEGGTDSRRPYTENEARLLARLAPISR